MRHLLICILMCFLNFPLNAQQEVTPWQSGCDQNAQRILSPLMGEDPYNAACEARAICVTGNPQRPAGCEFPVYDALMSRCEGDDCDLQSTFFMASLLIFERFPMSIYSYETRPLSAALDDTFRAFEASDYQGVIDIYTEIAAEREFSHLRSPFEDFIVGFMYEQLGDLESAAEAYRTSIDLLRMPFVTMQRAHVLIELGYEDVATAEASVISDYPIAETFLSEYPLTDEMTEVWVAYITEFNSQGEGGSYIADYTNLPGVPFQLSFLSDGSVLMNGATSTFFFYESEAVGDAVLFYPDEDGNGYTSDAVWMARVITLNVEDEIGLINSRIEGVMGYTESKVVMAPADTPNPVAGLDERCEDGARWRLMIDGYGSAAQVYDGGTPYYDAVGGEQAGALNADLYVFRVVDGPVCIGSQAWWEIDLLQEDGQTYWLPEAEASSPDEPPRPLRYLARPLQGQ